MRRPFIIPAQGAESALKVFSEQSGKGVIMNANVVDGIRTNRVSGAFAPVQALHHLLAGTCWIATPDEQSGAFDVYREGKPLTDRLPLSMPGDQAQEKATSPPKKT